MRKPVLRRGQTIWLEQASPFPRYRALRGHRTCDVAIVGGGMTGAMIAVGFAEAGARVAVVEAGRIACGSTAASTALLLQEPDYDLAALSKKYGATAGRRIWELGERATREFIDVIRRFKIACDLAERDSIYYTLAHDRAKTLRRELARRHSAGLAGEWLDPQALSRVSGIDGAGAILTKGNAQLNPLRACAGLIAAAHSMGASVFERATVGRISQTKSGVRLHTPGGTLDASQVVIATGYATKYFKPLAGRFTMRHTYVLATNRIGWLARRRLGLGPLLLWDTERPYHYVRWTPDHRLLLGGADRPVRAGIHRSQQFTAATRELRDYFEALFPVLREIGIDTMWEGLFAMTPDGLPYIGAHRRYARHRFALGYGGNGMTFAAIAARMLVEQWRGVSSPDHALFAFTRPRRR